jgi:hypothetical protein
VTNEDERLSERLSAHVAQTTTSDHPECNFPVTSPLPVTTPELLLVAAFRKSSPIDWRIPNEFNYNSGDGASQDSVRQDFEKPSCKTFNLPRKGHVLVLLLISYGVPSEPLVQNHREHTVLVERLRIRQRTSFQLHRRIYLHSSVSKSDLIRVSRI